MKAFLLMGSMVYFLTSCASTTDLSEENIIISMRTTPCFGSCPVFELTIYSDRTALLDAQKFMEREGMYSSRLKKKQFNQLVELFENSEFFELEDSYYSLYTDLSTTYLRYKSGGKDKTIMDYSNPPEALEKLEDAVKALVDQLIWRKED